MPSSLAVVLDLCNSINSYTCLRYMQSKLYSHVWLFPLLFNLIHCIKILSLLSFVSCFYLLHQFIFLYSVLTNEFRYYGQHNSAVLPFSFLFRLKQFPKFYLYPILIPNKANIMLHNWNILITKSQLWNQNSLYSFDFETYTCFDKCLIRTLLNALIYVLIYAMCLHEVCINFMMWFCMTEERLMHRLLHTCWFSGNKLKSYNQLTIISYINDTHWN